MKQHIAVVGAGFTSLAAAYKLNRGLSMTVLEARRRMESVNEQ